VAGNGSWTGNEFFYKPAPGARGVNEKALFDEGLDRIDARLGKILYVTDHKYGAVGDGIADDTAAVQNAINEINSRGGGVVFFPKGTYKISSQLNPCANLTLEGIKSQSKLKITNTGGYGFMWYNKDNITFRNLVFYSTDDLNTAKYCIAFHDTNNILIEDCDISYFNQAGIHCSGTANQVTIRNNHIHHVNTANMPVTPPGHNAIGSAGWSNVLMDGNYIHDIGRGDGDGDWGFYDFTNTGTTSENITFSNNVVKDCNGGIQTTPAGPSGLLRQFTITGNKFIGTKNNQAVAINQLTEDLVISNNVVTPADTNTMSYHLGVRGTGIKRYIIANNVVKVPVANSGYGCIFANGEKGVVANNTLYGNGVDANSTGIAVGNNDAQDITVHGNMIYNCSAGVWIYKAGAISQGIKVTNNYYKGYSTANSYLVRMGTSLASQVTISNNYVDTAWALVKAMGTDILIENNTVKNIQYLMWGTGCTRVLAQNNVSLDSTPGNAWYGTPTGPGGEDFRVLNTRRTPDNGVVTLANSATPAIWLSSDFKTGGATAITNLTKGFVGQTIRILAAHTVTMTHNANANPGYILLKGGVNFALTPGQTLTLHMFDQDAWREVARSD
jgi:hypothetical protein